MALDLREAPGSTNATANGCRRPGVKIRDRAIDRGSALQEQRE
jgi:hypothetical protein